MGDLEFGRRSLYLPDVETLVIADTHIGFEASSDVDFPVGEHTDLTQRLRSICADVNPQTVVVAGDFLHAFDGVPTGVHRTVDAVIDAIDGAELIITPGNHDIFLETVASAVESPEYYRVGDETIICHGHVNPPVTASRYIIGHDHPTLVVSGDRHPCFLRGSSQYEDASLVILPPFSRLPRGTPIADTTAPDLSTPLLTNIDSCRPVIVAETVHEFPPLADLRAHL